MNKIRYTIAAIVMLVGFLPMADTAFQTSEYIPLVDYITAMAGFLLACHITEARTNANDNDNP